MSPTPAVGIDLGTTNSCVAVYRDGKCEVIPNTLGKNTTPSYVAFTDTNILVGEDAKDQRAINIDNTVFDSKRMIGLKFNDERVRSDMKYWPFKVVEEDSKTKLRVKHMKIDKTFYPEEISAMVLIYLKRVAEDYLGCPVNHAIVTIPAYFNNSQREATKLAGEIAGLNVLMIITEPTAAAIAYSKSFKKKENNIIMVYDFGGGTFDVSVIKMEGPKIKVLAVDGATHLGGKDVDKNLVDYLIADLKNKHGNEFKTDQTDNARIANQCERVKIALSSAKSAYIELENLSNGMSVDQSITREMFERLNNDMFQSTLTIVDRCMKQAKINKSEIDEIILIGGSTRIPKVQDILQKYFDGKQLCKTINPDESVAIGAAIQATVLQKGLPNDKLQDVIPMSLGISVINDSSSDNLHDVIVKKNTAIPTKISKKYRTYEDNQTSIKIEVYEGEERLSKDNQLLGEFEVVGLTPAPKGVTCCIVTFAIDTNGIIKVRAKQINGDGYREITINRIGALYDEEIKRMIAAARQNQK